MPPAFLCHTAEIQSGGNDIDNKYCPLLLASKLNEYADWSRLVYGISRLCMRKFLHDPILRVCAAEYY